MISHRGCGAANSFKYPVTKYPSGDHKAFTGHDAVADFDVVGLSELSRIDDVRLYNRALTAEQVQTLYDLGLRYQVASN